MALSHADRAALEARAQGLRDEISSLTAEMNGDHEEAVNAQRDRELLNEIARLERERDEAVERRKAASGTVADALKAMNDAAAQLDEPAPAAPAPEPVAPASAPVLLSAPVSGEGE